MEYNTPEMTENLPDEQHQSPEQQHLGTLALLEVLKQAAELTHSQLSAIFDALHEGVMVFDAAGQLISSNQIARTMHGLGDKPGPEGSAAGLAEVLQAFDRHGTPLNPEQWPLFRALRGEQTDSLELRVIERSSGRHWVALYSAVPVMQQDHVAMVVLRFDDVSAQRHTEQKLVHSRALADSILDHSPDCIKILDRDAHLLYMNAPGQCLLEIDDFEKIRGSNWIDFWKGIDHVAAEQAIATACAGQVGRFQGFFATLKGTPKWWDVIIVPVAGSSGEINQLISISRDITALRHSEASIARLGRILDRSASEIYIFDAETLYLEQVSQGALINLGYSMDEMREMTPVDFKPMSRPEFEDLIAPLRRGDQEVVQFETVHQRKDGSSYPVDVRLQLSREENPPVFVAIIEDVSERKAAEAERARLLAREKEARAEAEILNRMGRSLSMEFNLDTLLQMVTDAATSLCGAEFGAFFYITEGDAGEQLTLYTLSGAPKSAFERFAMPRRTPVFVPTFTEGRALRSDDIRQDPRFGQEAPHFGMPPGHLPVVSYLAIPVTSRRGEAIGAMIFGHRSPGIFKVRHERLLSGLAAQAAIAIDNARLFTLEQQARERAAFLAQATGLLGSSLDYEETLSSVARLAVPEVADWFVVDLLQTDGTIRRVKAAHTDPGKEALALDLVQRFPPKMDNPSGVGFVLRCGRAELVSEITSEMLETTVQDPEYRSLVRELGLKSYMCIPLTSRGRVLGAISFISAESGRSYTRKDLQLAQELADRCAIAVDNAILFREAAREIEERKKAGAKVRELNTSLEQRVQERTAELLSANRELESFSYSVSHDLRGPLRAINGYSQMLVEDYGDRLNGPAHDYLDRIRAATERMGDLIDDLLSLSSLTRQDMQRSPVNLTEIAWRVIDQLRTDYGIDREVIWTIQPDLIDQGDHSLLYDVMQNLLDNALKFTASRPKSHIEFGRTTLSGKPAYFVRDNGIGFDMAYSNKLFKPFERLHAMTDYTGTGIGLATVSRIINRHGGQIWAEGKEGQGATFYFTLR